VRWYRRPTWDWLLERPISNRASGTLMSGAPSPMQLPGQSCALAGYSPLRTNRYERRRSFTKFGRSEVVKAPRIWSAQEGVLVQLDGIAAEPADADAVLVVSDGANARNPSWERRRKA
jgi:hypothetical protein